jgi:hypothetical protein
MLKYNISIIESHWLITVCISSGSYSQLMLGSPFPHCPGLGVSDREALADRYRYNTQVEHTFQTRN